MSKNKQAPLTAIQKQLQEANDRIAALEKSETRARLRQTHLEKENLQLKRENAALSRSLPIEIGSLEHERSDQFNQISLTFLGRDKALFAYLRKHFPHAAQFVGPTSAGFKRRTPPEVLICRLDVNDTGRRALIRFIKERGSKTAYLLYGPGSLEFIRNNRKHLLGSIAEVVYHDIPEQELLHRLNALVELRKAICSVEDIQCPLIGRSQKFIDVVTQILRLSRFPDPVLIQSTDQAEAISVANYIHRLSERRGKMLILDMESLAPDSDSSALISTHEGLIGRLFKRSRNGTLLVTNINILPSRQLEKLIQLADQAEQIRFIVTLNPKKPMKFTAIPTGLKSFVLELPDISQRKDDVPLFVHYFTLLHNLQLEKESYLSQAEVNELVQLGENSVHSIKNFVFEKLGDVYTANRNSGFTWEQKQKTLDEYVAEFEARIISDTLKQCEGNKSMAARRLGLRPNTLHYKLSRLGIHADYRHKQLGKNND